MSANEPTPWQLAAEELVAAAVDKKKWWELLRFELNANLSDFPPGMHYEAFKATDALYLKGEMVHQTSVIAESNGKLGDTWLGAILYAYQESHTEELIRSNLAICKERATAYDQVKALSQSLEDMKRAQTADERAEIIGRTITRLSVEDMGALNDPSALSAGERFESELNAEPLKAVATGVEWIDNLSGGVRRKEIWWIAGAYKMRKSTLMRIMALGAARSGASVDICAFEGSQQLIIAQLVTMLAVEWLSKRGHYNDKDGRGGPLHLLSAKQLLTLGNKYKTALHPLQVSAISAGILEYKRFGNKLRIYDSTPKNGNLKTVASINTVVMRGKQLYDSDVCFVDFLQRIGGGGKTIFDKTMHNSYELQDLALRRDIAMVILAQRNEETIRNGSDSHSPGVKGGGDPAATADYLFVTEYPKKLEGGDFDRNTMMIRCQLSRHGEAGVSCDLPIHPPTGLAMVADNTVNLKGY